MYPTDIREMAFKLILDLIHKSPVNFTAVHSHLDFSCKSEYEECISDIARYIVRDFFPLIPSEEPYQPGAFIKKG
jgi:hypothetical protein